jgi:predicted RNA binding protein YcfA (HicA-like mRNA interferase family)
MVAKLRRLKGKELISILQRLGFVITRIKGSHHFLKHPDGRCTTVPVHSGEEIGTGLLSKILRDVELSREDFERLS